MILVAGSANLDFVVRAAHIPAPGETVLGRDFKTFPGGKGANQAVACARAGGAATAMLLALGDDAFAQPLLDSLNAAQVQLHLVRAATEPTGTAFICVSDAGENAITVAPGANHSLAPEHLPSLAGITHLLMQLETPLPTVLAYAQAAKAQGLQVLLNAAPAQSLPAALLALVDMLIVNEGELAAIAPGHGTVQERLQQLSVPCVVVTLGAQGCVAKYNGQFVTQPAYPVKVLDTTAAGDTFCGALAAALSSGAPMQQALRQASAAAALACTQLGAQSSIPTHAAVQSFLHSHP
jgi:ribokinase